MILNKTKQISLALILALSVSLTACSNESASSSDPNSDATSSEAASSTSSETTDTVTASFGPATDFDYLNFAFEQDLTVDGLWDGVTASDFVTLPEDFASVTVPTAEVTPTDESIQYQLDLITNSYATTTEITDRAAQDGDTVYIDYAGSVGGVAFMGGTAENAELVLGSNKFIPGFEAQVVGHEIGETFDIVVTFPEGYSDSADAEGNVIVMSGAEATFTITLNSITTTVIPELTDSWVSDNLYATAGFTSVDDLTQAITDELFQQNIDLYMWKYLTENSEIISMPPTILNYQVCQFLSYYDAQAYAYNVDLTAFVTNFIGLESVDAFLAMQEESIVYYAEYALIVQAIAEQLELTVTDEVMEGYAEYLETNPEAYVALNALTNLVDQTLREGVVMS